MSATEQMPERINVTKVLTYDVAEIISHLVSRGVETPTLDDVVEAIEESAKDDFSCGFGHEASLRDLIFTEEYGDEI